VTLSTMVARLVVLVLLMTAAAANPAFAQRKQAKEQVEFGIQVAQRGLWKEAIYRWERATQLDPTYAAITSQSLTSTKGSCRKRVKRMKKRSRSSPKTRS